jgi:PIN domain nuclease of toxin-antitoxin system
VRILLDTHAFVWWVSDSDELSRRARRLIADGANEIFFSAASAWEIAIKSRLRRATLPPDAERFVREQLELNAFQMLPIQVHHALGVASLPALHRDPFDRMLVAQALSEELTLMSRDRRLADYSVRLVW